MISDEQIGQLLASQAECERHQRRISRELTQFVDQTAARIRGLEERQGADDEREARRSGVILALRVVGALALSAITMAGGYLWSDMVAQAEQVESHAVKLTVLEAEQERLGRAETQLRVRVRGAEGDLRELVPTIHALQESTRDLAGEVRELQRRRGR